MSTPKYPGGGKVKPKYDPDLELKNNFNRTLTYDNDRTVKDVVMSAAKIGKIDPSFLLSSAWQEGFNKAVISPDDISTGYSDALKKDKGLADYPVDGFFNYGLDTFGDNYNNLKKYLPEGFDKNFKTFQTTNEKNEKITTAAFKTNQDALVAKAAYLNSMRDDVTAYAKTKGLNNLDQKTSDYFTLASYNGGMGNARKMIDQYQASPDQANFIDKGLTQQQGVHKNIIPRLNREKLANDLLGITPPATQPTVAGQVTKPVVTPVPATKAVANTTAATGTMKKGGKMMPDGGKIGDPKLNGSPVPGINVFGDGMSTQVPINPDAPKDQQIFKIDQKGTVQQVPDNIIPLTQFADQSTDIFGNKHNDSNGSYVNDAGEVNPLAQQQAANDQISAQNKANATKMYDTKNQTEVAAGAGITAINAFFNKKQQGQQDRTNYRKAIMTEQFAPTFNPYAEGTGSQAIMKDGGKISGEGQGVKILDGGKTELISSSDHSNPMMEFQGREHSEGGIGVQYGGKTAEVEDKEIGFVDQQGGLNIFGKLKVPGTNQTFRKTAKDIAEQESKVDGLKSKYNLILQNTNPTNEYSETALSTAKVMFKSLDKQSKDIADKKEGLASFQNLILSMTQKQNVDEHACGGEMEKFEFGGKMPDGGRLDPNDAASIQNH